MLTTKETAERLGVSARNVRDLYARHVLEGEKRGRDLFITEESVARRIRKRGAK